MGGGRLVRAVVVVAIALSLGGCDWAMFKYGSEHTGFNPVETSIGLGNVADLTEAWHSRDPFPVPSAPAVAHGMVYLSTFNGELHAFDATGSIGCSGTPRICDPVWKGTRAHFLSPPAVSGGVVYVGATKSLVAYDAAGQTNCDEPTTYCEPLWTATTAASIDRAPVVVRGVVYAASETTLYAFDASGRTNCSGTPKACSPLWSASVAGNTGFEAASPAVADGVLYMPSSDGNLYAFDAAGTTQCTGVPKVCSPLWSGATGDAISYSPAVAHGVVYVQSSDRRLYAFSAAGTTNCSQTLRTCTPLWTAEVDDGAASSPTLAYDRVYVGSPSGALLAFDALGAQNCSGTPKVCHPLAIFGPSPGQKFAPAVANHVLYAVGQDSLSTYDANCSGFCPARSRLDVFPTSSPVVANGYVYVGSGEGGLNAYSLPAGT